MFLIGIAGGSGSGKTTFAKKILHRIELSEKSLKIPSLGKKVALLHQDSYYMPTPPAHLKINGEGNFDHPGAFDWPLLKQHLEDLKAGKQIDVPVYDYGTSRRTEETERVGPCDTILMEGIYTLWEADVRRLFDIRVYLHVDADIRFIRRLHRDVRERGRTMDSVIRQYYDSVRPMYHAFLEPTKQYADLVVGEETDIAAEVVAARIGEILIKRNREASHE